jgi:23S rRNA (guanine2445-N2)-methyltransferase / 23S rRNA (guanine2069-N7)-methyltransferase
LRLFASCPVGLEALLAEELAGLGDCDPRPGRGGVALRGDLEFAWRCCLWSRLASRVLWQVGRFEAGDAERLHASCVDYPWERHFAPGMTLAVDFIGRSATLRNSVFGAQRVKDAVVDRMRAVRGMRPDVDSQAPDLRIVARLQGNLLTLSLDLVGVPLHQRGYRPQAGAAPLKETLAAALLWRAGWPAIAAGGGGLYDPLCGSGTLLVEAALMAADVAPGLRRDFAFERWPDHDASGWRRLRKEAERRRIAGLAALPPIAGADRDAAVLEFAREALRRTELDGHVALAQRELGDCSRLPSLPATGLLIANPPYGERLGGNDSLRGLYRQFGDLWRQRFGAWRVALFSADDDLLRAAELPRGRSYRLRNGALDCRLQVADPAGDPERQPARRDAASAPAPLSEGARMFANRLRKNRRRLSRWLRTAQTDCYRLYDADMPEYAVAVDVYGDWLQVAEYAPPASVDPAHARSRWQEVLRAIPEALDVPAERIVRKRRERQRGTSRQYTRQADTDHWIEVREGPARLLVNLWDYLDTGLFLDHRPMRRRVAQLAGGKDLLNLFCYTAAATVQAGLAGAARSVSVDLSPVYLDWAARNLALNGLGAPQHELQRADWRRWLAETDRRFDLAFVDPPTFSNSKRMAGDFDVQRDHVELLGAVAARLRSGGRILFSSNRRRFELAEGALPGWGVEDLSTQSWDPDFARTRVAHACFLLTPP